MKINSPYERHVIELENLQLDKLVTRECSRTQMPCLVLKRMIYPKGRIILLQLFLKSPLDSHFLLIKTFHRLSDFVNWFLNQAHFSDVPYFTYLDLQDELHWSYCYPR